MKLLSWIGDIFPSRFKFSLIFKPLKIGLKNKYE